MRHVELDRLPPGRFAAIAEARSQLPDTRPGSAAPPPRLVRVDLNEQAYLWVRDRLLAREFGPGEKLGVQALADRLGVSRSPVHQALTRLVSEGLISSSRRGYAVAPITPQLMRESHDARVALELFAVEESIGSIAPETMAALRLALRRTIDPVRDGELVDRLAYLRANEAFHECIVDLPGNTVISGLYRGLHVHRLMERAYLTLSLSAAGNSSAEHSSIVEALERGDLDATRDAVRANGATGKRLALEAIAQAGGVL
jgi:DNA-binding GntR family transcriptional regulator